MAGPISGASRANGAMLITRYSRTCSREASGLRLKNSEPASDTATSASAAPDSAWASAKRLSPGVHTTRAGSRRRSAVEHHAPMLPLSVPPPSRPPPTGFEPKSRPEVAMNRPQNCVRAADSGVGPPGQAKRLARAAASVWTAVDGGSGQGAPRGQLDGAVVVAPRALDDAVDEERVERVRRPDAEDPRAVLLAQDLGPPGVDEQQGLPRADEADDRRIAVVVSGGDRQVGQVDERLAVLGAEPPQRRGRPSDGAIVARPSVPAHDGDLVGRRRSEPGQVATHEVVDGVVVVEVRLGTDPRLGERVQVGPAALPRARRRDPNEVDVHPDAVDQARARRRRRAPCG